MSRFKAFALAAVLAAGTALSSPVFAKAPIEAYGKLPNIAADQFELSPSGTRIAFVGATDKPEVRQLVVRSLAGETLLTANLTGKIHGVWWAGDDFVLIETSSTMNNTDSSRTAVAEFFQVTVANLKTKGAYAVFQHKPKIYPAVFGTRGVAQIGGRWYGFFRGLTMAGGGTAAIDIANQSSGAQFQPDHDWMDLYKVDLETGAPSILVGGGPRTQNWAVGEDGAVSAHSEYRKETGVWGLYQGSNGKNLMEVTTPLAQVWLNGPSWRPGWVIVTDESANGHGVQEVNLETGQAQPLSTGRSGWVAGYVHHAGGQTPVGVIFDGDRPETTFLDPAVQTRWEKAKKPFKDLMVSYVSADATWTRWILLTEGDGDSGTYWLVDLSKGSADVVATAYPDVDVADVSPSKVVTYKAADGLPLEAILTLPAGKEAKNLPLVVMPHGGPADRDHLGFDWLAQAFASRGYAVLQPNFRGSEGFTAEFMAAGAGEWGRKMQTDISDGVAELARQGVVDPKRACIVGWSYGGYAALAGVTLQHGLYRCAVSYGGVADLNLIMREARDKSNVYTRWWRDQIGAKGPSDPIVRQVNPAAQAANADAPILIMHGLEDSVVEITHARLMADALKDAKKPVELIEIQGADHWLTREAQRQQMLKAAVAFVEKHNPAN